MRFLVITLFKTSGPFISKGPDVFVASIFLYF